MKSQQDQDPLASSIASLLAEGESYQDIPGAAVKLPVPVRTGGGFDAALLMLFGIGAVVGGMVLSLGPKMSWKLDQIADGFKDLGVQGGVLVMGGMILAGLGLLRRGQNALRTPTSEQAEDRQWLEQLTKDSLRAAEDLARIEGGLVQMQGELADTRRELEERVVVAAREVIAAIPPPAPEVASSEEAIFRLAASLDQVGMRIEQRLKTQYTALQDHLEDVGAAILSARNQMHGLTQVGENHAMVLREQVQAQVECALEQTGFWAAAKGGRNGASLGVLDTIENDSAASMPDVGSIGSALPLNPEEAREHGISMRRADTRDEIDTKTRLVQLSTLLADPKLRKALEGISGS